MNRRWDFKITGAIWRFTHKVTKLSYKFENWAWKSHSATFFKRK